MRRRPELMQLEMGMSTMRYFPASGTAGFARSLVRGNNRVPWPPPIITERTLLVLIVCRPVCDITKIPFPRKVVEGKLYASSETGKGALFPRSAPVPSQSEKGSSSGPTKKCPPIGKRREAFSHPLGLWIKD